VTSAGTFRRILGATDGSERGQEAVRQAARLAHVTGATLIFAYVVDTGRPHDEPVESRATAILDAARDIARSVDVEADARVLTGDPGRALVEEAESDGFDLVALGPDAGLLGGAIRVGRVAAHVMREARCSVLIGRHAGPDFPDRIGCAVDGSEGSARTALVAATLAAAGHAELRLVHVVPVFRGDNSEWTLDADEESPPELEPAVLAASSRGVIPIREMAMGRPEHALVAAAERDATDLMVVGHRGISGVRRVLLGSVSEYVAHHAPCSVLIARSTDPDAS
jgi:nucleotide-binding universal stress UspA family protein